jgi:YggT family protein
MAIPGYGVTEQVFVGTQCAVRGSSRLSIGFSRFCTYFVVVSYTGGFTNFLSIYNLIITARILLSWFPQAQGIGVLQPVYAITDPYLNLFRGIIPPLFGLDFSPILAFFLLNLLSNATAAIGYEIPPELAQQKRYQLPSSTPNFRTSVVNTWSRRASRPRASSQLTLNY